MKEGRKKGVEEEEGTVQNGMGGKDSPKVEWEDPKV